MRSRHIKTTKDMKIQWNKVTWYSTVAAVLLGIGIFALGMYIGSLYERGRAAMEIVEGLKIDRKSIVERTTEDVAPTALFMQEGNIKNMATGEIEEDDWILIYDQPGAPALTRKLIFTTESRCVVEKGIPLFCNTANFEQGERVLVMGVPNEDGSIFVERLESVH